MRNLYRLVFAESQNTDGVIALTTQQNHYLSRVVRLQQGDRFIAMNGLGKSWLAQLETNQAKLLEILNLQTELAVNLTLITALPKGSGYEQVLRCCTELGVSRFVPVFSDRSLLKPSTNKIARWRKIVIEAAEQSEREIVPQILDPLQFPEIITQLSSTSKSNYICLARGNNPSLWSAISSELSPEIIIAIGAEGGWSDREIIMAQNQGFQAVSLGKSILRAVTAPIVAATVVSTKINEAETLKLDS